MPQQRTDGCRRPRRRAASGARAGNPHSCSGKSSEQKLDIGEISAIPGARQSTVTQNIYLHWRDEALHGRAQEVQILKTSNQKLAKKRKIPKVTLRVIGGVGLSL